MSTLFHWLCPLSPPLFTTIVPERAPGELPEVTGGSRATNEAELGVRTPPRPQCHLPEKTLFSRSWKA